MALTLLWGLALLAVRPPAAAAHDPSLYPTGGRSLYAGFALSRWQVGMSGNPRDPSYIAAVPVFGAVGLPSRWRLEGGGSVVASGHQDRPATRPCPSAEEDYCRGVVSLGALEALLSHGSAKGSLGASLGLGLRADPWNVGARTRYLNVGQGATGGLLSGSALIKGGAWRGVLEAEWWAIAGRWSDRSYRVPADALRGRFSTQASVPGHTWRVGCSVEHRTRGVDYGPSYLRRDYPTDERWSVVQFGQARAELGWSIGLPHDRGLHLSASAPFWTRNGPPDLLFAQVGVHQWRGPSSR